MKKMKSKLISNIIFYLVIILMGSYIIINAFMPTRVIDIFGFQGMPVLTPSMDPKIKVNDYIIITDVNPSKLEKDDIISFYTYLPTTTGGFSRQIVTHYVYDVIEDENGRYFQTYSELKDVNDNPVVDEWENTQGDVLIRDEDIIGLYQFRIPLLGGAIMFIQNIFQNPIMLVLIIVNITVIVVLIKYILKKPKEEEQK
ncbi:MAG: hypothetical protein RBT45_06485 [Acholeplasmataceae bacterium]|nr:hypothetical protein [Acholeplasmataceae bacterium]